MLPLPPPVFSGNTPVSPNYTNPNVKDEAQQIVNTRLQQGSSTHVSPGVYLSKDSLNVPLEVLFGITNQKTESSRPTLLPVFRSRYVEAGENYGLDSSADYAAMRDTMLSRLGISLEEYEEGLANGDLTLIATDQFVQFAAQQKTLAKQLQLPVIDLEGTFNSTEAFKALPESVKQNLIAYVNTLANQLSEYLSFIGPNHPAYDLWLNALNDLDEMKELLEKDDTKEEKEGEE